MILNNTELVLEKNKRIADYRRFAPAAWQSWTVYVYRSIALRHCLSTVLPTGQYSHIKHRIFPYIPGPNNNFTYLPSWGKDVKSFVV